ncbi:toll/interleukin-1 receptor domain-containing protein [Bradyrhizobium sp. Arg816]|uniref:toll/interleukin-1 receptor domain-containing protein n=1 Tax=Bradyrhizobium sp. Arg816 TaxID=2998491 RepID=UPI00249E65B7|nr:toll/interleukin-1 receptor domain-containing protein [Bradyrhizobium sp. Arg816]MDI3567271.1 toll/interleukin-1 receptor domain-containing protein [Bradyrhizobium sp. Arg816]
MAKLHDAFISHASEDKSSFVRPLAEFLKTAGVSVWYDEFALKAGDSLSRSIDKGLAGSKFGIVVLSEAFFKKRWTEYELSGLVAKEINGRKTIIPVWFNITKRDVLKFSPTLADKFALTADNKSIESIGFKIIELVKPDLFARVHQRLATMEYGRSGRAVDLDPKVVKQAPIRHGKLSTELTSRIRLIRAALLDVYPLPMEAWVDGFRRDTTPETEVAIWERLASVYLEYSYGKPKSARKNLYDQVFRVVAFGKSDGIPDDLLERASRALPIEGKERERYSARSYNVLASSEEEAAFGSVTKVTEGVPIDVVKRLRIDELNMQLETTGHVAIDVSEIQNEAVRRIMAEAGAILGNDKRTGAQAIFYGLDTLRQFSQVNENVRFPRPVVEVSYDSAGDQLEYLVAAVTILKGGCCYDRS